jgi:hypothetical protein
MDWPQILIGYSAGAAGTLSMYKLLRMLERRGAGDHAKRAKSSLFVNGEREEILGEIDRLNIHARICRRDREELGERLRAVEQRMEGIT